jgi:predicted nucleotidyltransferase
MVSLTQKEKEALLILFKDYTNLYNAHSLSKLLKISHVGTQKLLKRLKEENLVVSKTIGKAIIYKTNLDEDYNKSTITYLLADEANNYRRWQDEFKELSNNRRIVLLFGSSIRNAKDARDIDLMVVIEKQEYKEVKAAIAKRQQILPKPIHSIELTKEDLIKNLNTKKEEFVSIIKSAIILYGYAEYVEVMKDYSKF